MYYKIKTNSLDIRKILKTQFIKNNLEENQQENENSDEMKNTEQINLPNEQDNENIIPNTFSEKELELMREIYSQINSDLYPFVLKILDKYEFNGSPLYNPIGIDRETISQMIDQIINLAEKTLDEVSEIKLNRNSKSIKYWDNWALLRTTIESLLLNDIFGIRRPNYFKNNLLDIL